MSGSWTTFVSPHRLNPTGGVNVELDHAAAALSLVPWLSFSFSYGGGRAVSNLTVSVSSMLPDESLGPLLFGLVYRDAFIAPFVLNLRAPACTLRGALGQPDALAAVGGTVPVASSAVLDAAAAWRARFFPAHWRCSFPPATLRFADIASPTPGLIDAGQFSLLDSDMATKIAELSSAGFTAASARRARLSPERTASRGSFVLKWGPGLVTESVAVNLTVAFATPEFVLSLPGSATGFEKDALDDALVLCLAPRGANFVKPVTVCMHVGDTLEGSSRVLLHTRLEDASRPTRGWRVWQVASNNYFDSERGQLCGDIAASSCVAPFSQPSQRTASVVRKDGLSTASSFTSASCPSACSGAGLCRAGGRCSCFAGFSGGACEERTCPTQPQWAASLWDRSARVPSTEPHAPLECSGQGRCDRALGVCRCFDGFEGGACERLRCPNACSGRGRCRLLGELPRARRYKSGAGGGAGVPAVARAPWEAARITRCICDAGFGGADCSERVCPFGADPESTRGPSLQQHQTWRLSLDFGAAPSGLPDVFVAGDLALLLQTSFGAVLTTRAIRSVWNREPGEVARDLERSFLSLPGKVVDAISATDGGNGTSTYRDFLISFTGEAKTLTTGLACLRPNSSTLAGTPWPVQRDVERAVFGCPFAGCQPRVKQLALIGAPTAPAPLNVNFSVSLLREEAPLDPGDDRLPGVFAVTQTVTVNRRRMTAPGRGENSSFELLSFSVDSIIFGRAVASAPGPDGARAHAPTIPETPLPPRGPLRRAFPLLSGLVVDIADDDALLVPPLAPGEVGASLSYTFRWRLPSCQVSLEQRAGNGSESIECARRGTCNRRLGECRCFPGYAGARCSRRIDAEEHLAPNAQNEADKSATVTEDGQQHLPDFSLPPEQFVLPKESPPSAPSDSHYSDVLFASLDSLKAERERKRKQDSSKSSVLDSQGSEWADPSTVLERLRQRRRSEV